MEKSKSVSPHLKFNVHKTSYALLCVIMEKKYIICSVYSTGQIMALVLHMKYLPNSIIIMQVSVKLLGESHNFPNEMQILLRVFFFRCEAICFVGFLRLRVSIVKLLIAFVRYLIRYIGRNDLLILNMARAFFSLFLSVAYLIGKYAWVSRICKQ